MIQNRNTLILLAAGILAFGAFLMIDWSGGDDGRSGNSRVENDVGGPGAESTAIDALKRSAGTTRSGKKPGGGKKKPADPKLVRKLKVPEDLLVADGPPESPKPGLVQQSFTGVGDPTTLLGGGGGSTGGSGEDGDGIETPEEEGGAPEVFECPNCSAPSVRTMIVDLQAQPVFNSAFETTCSSSFIDLGLGERFNIGDDPACVMFVPDTCRGSGAALFDGKFFISLQGECIPNREFLKSVLIR